MKRLRKFNPALDVELDRREHGCVIVSLHSYNHGESKLRIVRRGFKWPYLPGKLGRFTRAEGEAIISMLRELMEDANNLAASEVLQ